MQRFSAYTVADTKVEVPRFGNALLGRNLESSLCSVAKKEKGKNEKRAVFPDGPCRSVSMAAD